MGDNLKTFMDSSFKTEFFCGYANPNDKSCDFCLNFNKGKCKLNSINFYSIDNSICDYCINQESNKCLICRNK